jgi:hypothetical protein
MPYFKILLQFLPVETKTIKISVRMPGHHNSIQTLDLPNVK